LLALDLNTYFSDEVRRFVEAGKAVIGICNGFQALVKAGILPSAPSPHAATLTFNACGHFECRWVTLRPVSQQCIWTRGLSELIYCPIAHGEGNFQLADEAQLSVLASSDQIALVYSLPGGSPAGSAYPHNPNGSVADIAGICNPQGNVLGLMPHPEDHLFAWQHPRWSRGEQGQTGQPLFTNGVEYAKDS
jgi:phosphoribosylformylglycinamidine (FGAM) synthase-like amidotransferase family enzyme